MKLEKKQTFLYFIAGSFGYRNRNTNGHRNLIEIGIAMGMVLEI